MGEAHVPRRTTAALQEGQATTARSLLIASSEVYVSRTEGEVSASSIGTATDCTICLPVPRQQELILLPSGPQGVSLGA